MNYKAWKLYTENDISGDGYSFDNGDNIYRIYINTYFISYIW